MKRRTVLGLLSVLAAFATTGAFAQSPTLVFTAIPDEDETRLVERFSIYAKYRG